VLGRFLSPDSIVPRPGDPQMLNRYAYVRNNPLKYADPTGHDLQAGAEFLLGMVIQQSANNLWMSPQAREALSAREDETVAMTTGRLMGDVASALQGVSEVVGGVGSVAVGTASCGTAVLCAAGAGAAIRGVAAVAHGGTTIGVALGDATRQVGVLFSAATRGSDSDPANYRVYVVRDPETGEPIYVGKTTQELRARQQQHNREKGVQWDLEAVKTGLTKNEAKYWEQKLFEQYGGKEKLVNRNRPVQEPKWEDIRKMFEDD
jgi:hypothetical protein